MSRIIVQEPHGLQTSPVNFRLAGYSGTIAMSLARVTWFVDLLIRKLAFNLNQFAFSAAVQLTTTVSGCDVSSATGVFTRNRWSSAATSYVLPRKSATAWSWNSSLGVPGSNDAPRCTGTAV